jgi:hypothetical protein
VLRIVKCVQFVDAEIELMSMGKGWIEPGAVADTLAASGVQVTPDDAEAVARALERIAAAAAILFASQSFDDTAERYFRLLEGDDAGGAEA